MKIGILGSSGFIGKNASEFLKKDKNFKVFNFSSYKKYKKSWQKKILKEIRTIKPDLILNSSASQLLTENKTVDFTEFNDGIYIVKVKELNSNFFKHFKIIKK